MNYSLISLVLPAYRQADDIGKIVHSYAAGLSSLSVPYEMVLAVNGPADGTLEACLALQGVVQTVKVVQTPAGWGHAVHCGIGSASGDLLCYTNSARTSVKSLLRVLGTAIANPGVVVKASRSTNRDNIRRRIGSLLYNLECRWLLDVPSWDVNGTPKAFPRTHQRLLSLETRSDLIDLEFCVTCWRYDYPLLEVPTRDEGRHGGASTTNSRSALHMYAGAYRLARQWRDRGG